MNDNDITNLLIKNGKINTHYRQIISKNKQLELYINNRFNDSDSIVETIHRIYNGIEEKPRCLYCGNPLKFISGIGYKQFCSVSCSKRYIKHTNIKDIDDDIIKKDYILNNGNINSNKLQEKYIKEHGYYNYLINRYLDSDSLSETVYRICTSTHVKPKCKICGNTVRLKSLKEGFDDVCSDSCYKRNVIIDDSFIKSLSLKGQIFKKDWDLYNDVYEYLKLKFGDQFRTYDEAVYMIRHDMNEIPRCSICGKFVQFKKNRNREKCHYTKYCSKECYSLAVRQETVDKIKQETGLDIKIEGDNYKFTNVCDVHKIFYMDIDMFHNRCKLDRLRQHNAICPICNPERNIETNIEQKIKILLDNKNLNYIQHVRNIIEGKELDFYLPDYNLAIECNGMYWHSVCKKEKTYHKEKYELCKEKGITLLQFWEYDIINSINVISNIIDIHTGNRQYLPDTYITVKEIDNNSYIKFNQQNWFKRVNRYKIKLGLYKENELISTLGVRMRKGNIEIHNIVLLNKIVKNTITYFIDFIKKHYSYNKILLLSDNDLQLFNLNKENKQCFREYYFYYDYKKENLSNKKLYSSTLSFLCYTSGITVYTLSN